MYRCLWLKNTNSREKQIYTRCKHFLLIWDRREIKHFIPFCWTETCTTATKGRGWNISAIMSNSSIHSRSSHFKASTYFFQGWGKTLVALRHQQHAVWVEGTLLCCLHLMTNIEHNGCTSSFISNHTIGYKHVFIFSWLKIDYLHCFLQLVDHLQMCFWWSVLMIEIGKRCSPCQGGDDA